MLKHLWIQNVCLLLTTVVVVHAIIQLNFEHVHASSELRGFSDPRIAAVHFDLLSEIDKLLAISPKPDVFNFSQVCKILEKSIPSIGVKGIMKAGFLHWRDVPAAAFLSSEEFLTAWVQGMNHFLGAWVMEYVPQEAVTLLENGDDEYGEAIHGALTLWGAQHAPLTPRAFWVAAPVELHTLSKDLHSLGHAAFMHAVYAIGKERPGFSACQFPTTYLRGYLTVDPGPVVQTAIQFCAEIPSQTPSNSAAHMCAYGLFHSARAYLSFWYSRCKDVCETVGIFGTDCQYHCTHDWSSLSYRFFYAQRPFEIRAPWYNQT